ncbi:MAG: glycosyltransferase family 4 protein [Armatimonadetes bacterium]|nr:glycosyltransferase family 4 protein [Armatimonadota bacterium]
MRVAIVTTSYWPIVGGQMIYARDLARELVRQGHTVTVAARFTSGLRPTTWDSLSSVDPAAAYDEDGVQVRVIRPRGLRRLALYPVHRLHYYERTERWAIWLFQVALTDALDQAIGPCDVVHFNGVGREMLGFCAEAVARRRRVPFVLTTHMHPGTWGDSRLDFRLYRMADRILAHTQWERGVYIASGIEPGRVDVAGIGVPTPGAGDADRARARHGLADHLVVLFVARKAHYKGYGLLLESAPLVWRDIPDAQFVFVGPEQDEPTPEQERVLADPRVTETGALSDADRNDLYAACTMLCVPSSAESFGLIYFEAWRNRKPVVALDLPPLRELIGGCGGGVLVGERTTDKVAHAIIGLLRDPQARLTMGTNGESFAGEYTPDRVLDRIIGAYQASTAELRSGKTGERAA